MSNTAPKIHPITGQLIWPLGIIGGRTVWPIMGGSEPAPEPPPADDDKSADPPADPPADDKGDKGDKGGKLTAADLEAALKETRAENAKLRVKTRDADKATADKINAALKALGVDVGKDEDPVKVAQEAATTAARERDTATGEVRSLRAEVIVWRNAAALGVNAAVLTDSRSFERVVAELDPAADDFEAKVKKAAQDAAKNNPALQAQGARGKGGAEFNGGTGEGAKRANSLEEAIAARLGV